MTATPRIALVLLSSAGLLLAACGDDDTSASRAASTSPLSETEFVRRADQICAQVASRFGELEDPDGQGGAKPIGLGGFIRDWVDDLRTLAPPAAIADDWNTALDLLEESGDKLDEAEEGDESAQDEALFDLQARAQQHIDAMGVEFERCFKE